MSLYKPGDKVWARACKNTSYRGRKLVPAVVVAEAQDRSICTYAGYEVQIDDERWLGCVMCLRPRKENPPQCLFGAGTLTVNGVKVGDVISIEGKELTEA